VEEQEKKTVVDEVVTELHAQLVPDFERLIEDKLKSMLVPADWRAARDAAEQWRTSPGRVSEVVRFVIPAEMHPDREGHVCPAIIANAANERNEADLVVLLFGVGPQSIAGVPFDDDEQAPGTWHRLPPPFEQLA